MPLRFLVYLARALQNIRADARGDGPGIKIKAALPVVVFSGDGGWTAPTDLLDAPDPGGLLEAARPRMPCQVLDVRALARDSEGVREICSWIGQVEMAPFGAVPMRVAHEALEKYPGTEHAGLRQALTALMHEVARTNRVPEEEIAKMATLEDVANNWQPAVDKAIARYRQEGRLEASRRMALRFARQTFDADAVAELAAALDEITDPDRFEKIADWIFECDSGDDLLDRVRNGHG